MSVRFTLAGYSLFLRWRNGDIWEWVSMVAQRGHQRHMQANTKTCTRTHLRTQAGIQTHTKAREQASTRAGRLAYWHTRIINTWTHEKFHTHRWIYNWRINNPVVSSSEMTFGPTKTAHYFTSLCKSSSVLLMREL